MIRKFLRNESGSASVEFALLAIPLFIPLFIFLNSYASLSYSQESLRTLAREAARGFVLSSSDKVAFAVAEQIVVQGGLLLGYPGPASQSGITIGIQCSARPCISPDSQITISLSTTLSNSQIVKVAAIEYVSPWA